MLCSVCKVHLCLDTIYDLVKEKDQLKYDLELQKEEHEKEKYGEGKEEKC
jgi:hypothetical protein